MIFDLKDKKTWEPILVNYLRRILGDSYADIVKENSTHIQYRDSEYEACELFSKTISRESLIELITEKITNKFDKVLTYHACRPNNTESYYINGIVPLSPTEAQDKFLTKFAPYASKNDIKTAIDSVSTETRDGVVHTVLDDRIFIKYSGHYLIYGGEYLHCLAVHLPKSSDQMRDILKQFGKATIFICHLPFSKVSDFSYLVKFMMADHFFRVAHNSEKVTTLDFTIFLNEKIPAEYIISHYHPSKIVDPFRQNIVWDEKKMEYDYSTNWLNML